MVRRLAYRMMWPHDSLTDLTVWPIAWCEGMAHCIVSFFVLIIPFYFFSASSGQQAMVTGGVPFRLTSQCVALMNDETAWLR